MPIFEFKCLSCQELFELLFINSNDEIELECPRCHSGELQRVLSASNYSMGSGAKGASSANSRTRSCGDGSCTTYDIPGPAR